MSAEELPVHPHPAAPRPQQAPGRRAAGRFLTLVGLTPDGRQLRLADPHDPSGAEFTVDVDARLRAVLGATPTTGRSASATVETQMDSLLRPRDIQARIRSGETPESVAAAAGTPVEKVMTYAAPVLAEREHIAQRAQRSSLRRPAGAPGEPLARTLGDAVTGHLHGRNIDPETVAWDSWRREDGRWALTGRYTVQGRDGLAELTFDPPGNFVVLENDDARWLVGDLPEPVAEPEPAAETTPEPRRLSAVPDEEQLALGDDVLGLDVGAEQPLEAFLDGPAERRPDESTGQTTGQSAEPSTEQSTGTAERVETVVVDEEQLEIEVEVRSEDDTDESVQDHEPPRRAIRKTRGRASVPSWDEIMFGGPGDR